MGKYKQVSKELLTSLVDSLVFIGKATKDTNQLRSDILKSRLPAKMKQLTKNAPAESELLFGDDLSKRISQINNTKSASAKPAFTRPSQKLSITKVRYPTTPPALITNNQKTDTCPNGLCHKEKGKQA